MSKTETKSSTLPTIAKSDNPGTVTETATTSPASTISLANEKSMPNMTIKGSVISPSQKKTIHATVAETASTSSVTVKSDNESVSSGTVKSSTETDSLPSESLNSCHDEEENVINHDESARMTFYDSDDTVDENAPVSQYDTTICDDDVIAKMYDAVTDSD